MWVSITYCCLLFAENTLAESFLELVPWVFSNLKNHQATQRSLTKIPVEESIVQRMTLSNMSAYCMLFIGGFTEMLLERGLYLTGPRPFTIFEELPLLPDLE